MKKLLVTLSLLLSLGLSASAVAAQGVEAPDFDELPGYEEVDGLVSIYDRTFSVDFETMLASPDANMDGVDVSAMMRAITIQGMTFDSEDSAKAYLDDTKSQIEEGMDDAATAGGEIEVNDLEGFDVEGLHITMNMPESGIAASMIVFVDGNTAFQVMVMDSELDAATTLSNDVTQLVVDAEMQTEEVTFSDDGTSTGGVFDRMPTADDEVVGDLTSVMDTELYVAAE